MELRQLKYFLAVAQELHFGLAAKKMNISQPPLSMQIKQLEEELEIKLFKRSSRSVELTPQGEYLKNEVTKLLNNLEASIKSAQKIARGDLGILRIGFVAIVTQSKFPLVIRKYKEIYPDVQIEITDLSSSRQLNFIKNKELDIALLNSFGHDLKNFNKKRYMGGKFKVAVPANHRLANEKEVNLKDFKGENILMFKREVQPILFDSILQSFEASGASPFSVQEINQRITTLALAAAGMGIVPVSPPVQNLRNQKDVKYLNIKDPFPEFEIAAVWSKDNDSPRLKAFMDILFDKKMM